MTRPNTEYGLSARNPSARYHLALAACFLLVTGPALGAPAASNTNGAVASVSQQNLPFSVRHEIWLGLTNAIDQNKFERIWQCMQFLGAAAYFAEAINICAPCVSAGGRIGTAALTDQERSCVNRRRSNGSGGAGSQTVGDDQFDATVKPQCSAANPGLRADSADAALDRAIREFRKSVLALQDARERLEAAREREREVQEALIQTAADDVLADQDTRSDEDLDALYALSNAATRARELAEERLREAEATNVDARHRVREEIAAWYRRHQDPVVDPTGQNIPGGQEDPRCEGQRRAAAWGVPWSDICRGEDGHLVDFKECHRRMTDPIYAASGGRCWTEPGPDDAARKVCRDDTVRGGNGGNTQPCDSAEPGAPCLNEPAHRRRAVPNGNGSASIGPLPSPIKPFLDQMCAKGRCPDPAPFNGPIDRGANGSAGASNMMPSAPSGQALRLKGLKLAPSATRRFLPQGLQGTGGQQGKLRAKQTPSYGQGLWLRQFGSAPALRAHIFQQKPKVTGGFQSLTSVPTLNLVRPSVR